MLGAKLNAHGEAKRAYECHAIARSEATFERVRYKALSGKLASRRS